MGKTLKQSPAAHLFVHSCVHSLIQILVSTYPLSTVQEKNEAGQAVPSRSPQPGREGGQPTTCYEKAARGVDQGEEVTPELKGQQADREAGASRDYSGKDRQLDCVQL